MRKYLLLILTAFFAASTFSQYQPGTILTLESSVLKEKRKIQVYNPANNKSPKQEYPVIYVLDGESLFEPTLSATRFMHYGSSLPQLPEAIIVAIHNTNRDRDMPVPQAFLKTNGAANFLRFITEELVPYINKQYPVNGLNVLAGHSQGGLFVTYAGLQQSSLFPFILALDAPMTVDAAVLKTYVVEMLEKCPTNYFSGETMFGWGKDLPLPSHCRTYSIQRIEGETHETMPYKGIYEGLKFLFREHIPQKKDMDLPMTEDYYKNLSQQYNCRYAIPAAYLLSSARQQISSSKKTVALVLLERYKKLYGAGQRSAELFTKANSITGKPDERVDYYINHPGATAEELKLFMGKWKGVLVVPGGSDMASSWEIKKTDEKWIRDARVMDAFNERSNFLLVTKNNELVWGRIHEGGGIYLSIGKLSADGQTLSGTEDLVGFTMPAGIPPFTPNTFTYTRVKE